MADNACRACNDRTISCHVTCVKYLMFQLENEAAKSDREKSRFANNVIYESTLRAVTRKSNFHRIRSKHGVLCNKRIEKIKKKTGENKNEKRRHYQGTYEARPNRGNSWGSNTYRGNCSGWIHAFLIWKYQVKRMAELFAGSGTGSDVCKDMEIPYIGADLNPCPVRKNILTVNAVTDEVPDEFRTADMLFMHPPYSELIKIGYANQMWSDPTGELSKFDLGQMPWQEFIKELNAIVMKYYAAMEPGSRIAILMGDVRRGGLHSMLTDIVKPGQLEQIIIKMQHNTVSGRSGKTYGGHKNFVPLVHEYILVMKKLQAYMIDFQLPQNYRVDIRDSKTATWKDVVCAVMNKFGTANLETIYLEIATYKKAKDNPHYKEKVRQILQQLAKSGVTRPVSRGVWAMAA